MKHALAEETLKKESEDEQGRAHVVERGIDVVADDDPHIPVYMGHSIDSLFVQGHIYIVWDEKARTSRLPR